MNPSTKRTCLIGITLLAATTATSLASDKINATNTDGISEPVVTLWSDARKIERPTQASALGGDGTQPFAVFLSTNADPEGDLPREVVFLPDGESAVIVHRDTDNLTFFDVDTRTVTHTVPVEDFPPHVAATPDGQYVLAPNVFSNTVSIVDLATHIVAANVPVTGDQPFSVAVTADSQFAVVGVINDGVNSAFSVIDLNTLTEVRTIPTTSQGVIGFFFSPESGISGNLYSKFAVSPDNSTIVLPDRGNSRVMIYDLNTGDELAALPTAAQPTAVDISDDGSLAVVSHEGATARISRIDLEGLQVTDSFNTLDNLSSQIIRLTPDASHAMTAISNNVIFTNLTTGARTATIMTGVVGDIEVSFDGQYAFVSNFNARVINIATQSLVDTIPFGPCVESATSPTELRAVAINNRFAEDIHFYNINGAAGFLEGFALSGEPPEGDATRVLAISPDGTTAVAANNTSRNVAIIDIADGSIRAYIDTGARPLDLAITPDNAYAVVTNTDSSTVSVIDLDTDTEVANLNVPTRPARIRISPDGTTAYVLSVAGTDRVHFIDLDGANSSVTGSLISGQTGSAQGYPYTEVSGIELSTDGSVLAVCVSFADELLLIDTATQSEITRVNVGDFPIRVTFSPDGGKAYVANAFSDSISVVVINGAASFVQATVPGVDFPLTMNVDPASAFVYVGTFGQNSQPMRVLNAATNTFVQSLSLNGIRPRSTHLSTVDSVLYLGGNNPGVSSAFMRVQAAGAASFVIDSVEITSSPSDMRFSDSLQTALCAQPIPDGVDFVVFGAPGDFDGDGDVDIFDFEEYLACVTGPATESLPPACAVFDFDDDDDVDFADMAAFMLVYENQ